MSHAHGKHIYASHQYERSLSYVQARPADWALALRHVLRRWQSDFPAIARLHVRRHVHTCNPRLPALWHRHAGHRADHRHVQPRRLPRRDEPQDLTAVLIAAALPHLSLDWPSHGHPAHGGHIVLHRRPADHGWRRPAARHLHHPLPSPGGWPSRRRSCSHVSARS